MTRAFAAAAVVTLTLGLAGCALLPHHGERFAGFRPIKTTEPLSGSRVDGYYASAKVAIERRDYARALDLLQAARALAPNDVRIVNAFAVVYDKLGRFDLSERYYLQANALDPHSQILASNEAWSATLRAQSTAAPAPMIAPSPAPIALASLQPASPPAIDIATVRPAVVRIGYSRQPTVLLAHRALVIEDASGRKNGVQPLMRTLVQRGWTQPQIRVATTQRQASMISYPSHAEGVAKALSRTLPVRVALVNCGDRCEDIRLVVGADMLVRTARPAPARAAG